MGKPGNEATMQMFTLCTFHLCIGTYDVQNLHVNVNEDSADITADFIENSMADGVLCTVFGPDGAVVNSSVVHRENCTGTGSSIVISRLPVGENVFIAHDIERDGSLTKCPAIITTAVVEHSAGTQSGMKVTIPINANQPTTLTLVLLANTVYCVTILGANTMLKTTYRLETKA